LIHFIYCNVALRSCHHCDRNLEERIKSLTGVCFADTNRTNRQSVEERALVDKNPGKAANDIEEGRKP
jgi:hypothetical protein